jgi:tRNA (cmo5U34)-methyltransferase
MKKDSLYASPRDVVEPFRFDRDVATVFDDMIRRSVPAYATIVTMTESIAATQARIGGRCYDLGCSLGESTAAMLRGLDSSVECVVAVDSSEDMIETCRKRFSASRAGAPVDLLCADIRDVDIQAASLVVLNFTLMFIPLQERLRLLERIFAGMLPGGVLLLSEKIRPATEIAAVRDLHEGFKRTRAYSDLEISQKREALENVLVPDTLETHCQRIDAAGFSRQLTWLQCLGFASIAAWK